MDDQAHSTRESFVAAEIWMNRASVFYLASMCAVVASILSLLAGSLLSPSPLNLDPLFLWFARANLLVCMACAYATWYCNRRLKSALSDL